MIRKSNSKDDGRIAEILVFTKRMCYRDIFQDDNESFNELQVVHVMEELKQREDQEMLVYDDGIIKGMLYCKDLSQKMKKDTWELNELYVDFFFQGSHIGNKLLKKFFEIAKNEEENTIKTWVIKDNINACRFYEHNGFYISEDIQFVEGTNIEEVQYICRLS